MRDIQKVFSEIYNLIPTNFISVSGKDKQQILKDFEDIIIENAFTPPECYGIIWIKVGKYLNDILINEKDEIPLWVTETINIFVNKN